MVRWAYFQLRVGIMLSQVNVCLPGTRQHLSTKIDPYSYTEPLKSEFTLEHVPKFHLKYWLLSWLIFVSLGDSPSIWTWISKQTVKWNELYEPQGIIIGQILGTTLYDKQCLAVITRFLEYVGLNHFPSFICLVNYFYCSPMTCLIAAPFAPPTFITCCTVIFAIWKDHRLIRCAIRRVIKLFQNIGWAWYSHNTKFVMNKLGGKGWMEKG